MLNDAFDLKDARFLGIVFLEKVIDVFHQHELVLLPSRFEKIAAVVALDHLDAELPGQISQLGTRLNEFGRSIKEICLNEYLEVSRFVLRIGNVI